MKDIKNQLKRIKPLKKDEPKMGNSEIYYIKQADQYFERNKEHLHSFFIDYFLSLFSKTDLIKYDIAEFGIGNGQNLLYLKQFCNKTHGYEISVNAVKYFKQQYENHPSKNDFYSQCVNLSKPFQSPFKYDLVIFGFFPYYVDNEEMKVVKQNTLQLLKENSYIYIFDFLVREEKVKTDSREKSLRIFKRSLSYWLDYFSDFNLIDFRLFDCNKSQYYKLLDTHQLIDSQLTNNDDDWQFAGLFKRR